MKRIGQILALVALLTSTILTAEACGAKSHHISVVADSALYEVLNNVHEFEQVALCGKPSCAGIVAAPTVAGWNAEKSQAFNKKLLPAVQAGRQFNELLGQWKPGTPAPQQLRALISSLSDSLTAVVQDFPDGGTKTSLLANIGKAQALILNAVNLVLSVKGA